MFKDINILFRIRDHPMTSNENAEPIVVRLIRRCLDRFASFFSVSFCRMA